MALYKGNIKLSGTGNGFAPLNSGSTGQVLRKYGNGYRWENGTGTGDVNGPASSTDGDVALFDGVTGKLIKDSGISLSSKADVSDLNTKTFYLSSSSDLTTAQDAYDWYVAGKNPIIVYDTESYIVYSANSTFIYFGSTLTSTALQTYATQFRKDWISFTLSSGTVTTINVNNNYGMTQFLATDVNYSSPYTPQYDGSPATKKYVDDKYADLMAMGKFLSLWDCATGQPISFPLSTPYTYHTGDYYMVETVSSATPAVNYKPNGSSYTGTASSTTESGEVAQGDFYVYDGSVWLLATNHGKTVSFANLAGQPSDNANLATALNSKQDNLSAGQNIDISSNTVSTKWVSVTVATASTTATKVGTTTAGDYTPTEGDLLMVTFENGTNVANPTLDIDGSGAKYIRLGTNNVQTSTRQLADANSKILMYYDGTYYRSWCTTNSTYNTAIQTDSGPFTAGTGTYAVQAYNLVMQKSDGTWEKLTDTSVKYAVADLVRAVNTNGFVIDSLRYWSGNTDISSGGMIGSLTWQTPALNAADSVGCGNNPGWSAGDVFYLVGSLGVDGLFYLDSTQYWTTTLPNTADGKLYIKVGIATGTNSRIALLKDKTIYYYDNGIKIYQQADNKQDKLVNQTNIKSINGNSLLGSGDLTISGGITNETTGTTSTVTGIWSGTESEYSQISTPSSTVLYFTF